MEEEIMFRDFVSKYMDRRADEEKVKDKLDKIKREIKK